MKKNMKTEQIKEATTGKNCLKVSDVSYSYKNASGTTKVLDGVNAEFVAGKMYAIVGESGSGKTTLLSLIAALDKLQDGDITYNEKSIRTIGSAAFRLKYVNIVFQQYNLIKYMTARENVQIAIDFDNRKSDPDRFLAKVGLSAEESGRLIGKLSGGQQQRVAIARAIASNSPVIVADEPTGNLDEDTEEKIIDLFRTLAREEHKIVIIVTHSKKVAEYADEILHLRRGKLS